MKKCLIVVDYQWDFVADDGKLTAGEPAKRIEQKIVEKINACAQEGYPVFYTMDAHTKEDWDSGAHPESAAFGAHCVKGTEGYALYGQVGALARPEQLVDKRAYCPDLSTGSLREAVFAADEIEVCGVVTDICVFQTVIGLYTALVNSKKAVKLVVDKNACASFNPEREAFALDYMRDILGVTILGG